MKFAYVASAGAVGLALALSATSVSSAPDRRPMTSKQRANKALDGRIKALMAKRPTIIKERVVYVDRPTPAPYTYPTYSYVSPTVGLYGLGYTAASPVVVSSYADGLPLQTGRSAATLGAYCTTPVKSCLLNNATWVGSDCSCAGAVTSYGSVTP